MTDPALRFAGRWWLGCIDWAGWFISVAFADCSGWQLVPGGQTLSSGLRGVGGWVVVIGLDGLFLWLFLVAAGGDGSARDRPCVAVCGALVVGL